MSITYKQATRFLSAIALTVPDQLNCDGCFELAAVLADAEQRGDELSDALLAVRIHLTQCPCCAYEYRAMLDAIQAAET